MGDAIQVNQLTKVYAIAKGKAPVQAVAGIDFAVREGEVFGFLGPNGAGKTMTIRMLTGLCRPTSGRATVLGLDLAHDVTSIKKRIGVVPEASNLYDELTVFLTTHYLEEAERLCDQIAILAAFAAILFLLAVHILARRLE